MEATKKALTNWKLHGCAILVVIFGELVGTKVLQTPIGIIMLFPMIFAMLAGVVIGLPKLKILKEEDQHDSNMLLMIAVLVLLAKVGSSAGPNFYMVMQSGVALVLQELGNIFTCVLAVPVGVALGLRREVVGAAHSISRDSNLALVTEIYGLDSEEGRGVLGAFLYGSLFGTIIMGVLTSIVASWNIFSIEALSMATGVGSTSFTAGATASLINLFPAQEQVILAYSASSSLLTGFDAVYITLILALPMARGLYKISYRIKYGENPAPEVRKGIEKC